MEIIIPENAGLGEWRQLLTKAENLLAELNPKFAQYRIDASNAKADYEFELAVAKVKYQDEKTATMMNAKAATDKEVRSKQLEYRAAAANLILAEELMKDLQGKRDTLKCMIKSEQQSY